jgi:hypothetical protein
MKKSFLKLTLFASAALVFAAQSSFAGKAFIPAAPAPQQQAAPNDGNTPDDVIQGYNQPNNTLPVSYGGSNPPASAPQAKPQGLSEVAKLKAEIARLKRQNAYYKKQAAQACQQATVSSNDVKGVVPAGAASTGQNDGSGSGDASGGDGYGFHLGDGPAPIFTLPPGALTGGNAAGNANGADQPYPSTR